MMFFHCLLASLTAILSLTSATPQNFLPSDAPTCHGKPICCQKFFTGSTAPFPLPYNLACLDLRPTDLQCIYTDEPTCTGTWACCIFDIAPVAMQCSPPPGICGKGTSISPACLGGAPFRMWNCIWGDSPKPMENLVKNFRGDTVVDRIHEGVPHPV